MNRKALIFFLFILATAGFLRLWQLDSIPPGLWPDEAINANTALQIADTGKFQLFYPENHGREGLFFLLISFAFSVFGVSVWSFKLVSALAGILTVVGIYLLAKELFSKYQNDISSYVGLLASFFLAISFWHINFSRIGFRAILLPLILTYSFYFFFRGWRTRQLFNFILSGIIFGLGFYSYASFRLAVLPLAFVLIFWFFMAFKENWAGKFFIFACLLLLAVFIVGLPLGVYFLENPEYFVSRALGVSIFGQEHPVKSLLQSLIKHLLMFNFSGDLNWRHNFSGFPELSPAVSVFLFIGLGFFAWHVAIAKSKSLERLKEIGNFLFLVVWIFALLLPGILTIEGIPHALRTIGVIPPLYILAGLGAWTVFKWSEKVWAEKQINLSVLKIISFGLLVLMAFSSFLMYFFFWAKSTALESAFAVRFMDVGKELNALPLGVKKYVVAAEGELPTEVPKFIQQTSGRNEASYIEPEQLSTFDFYPGDFVFLMNKEFHYLDPLERRFPQGVLHDKERILIFEVK